MSWITDRRQGFRQQPSQGLGLEPEQISTASSARSPRSIFSTRTKHTARSARTQAFTLIELLVVISIISLLMAILLPVMKSARSMAKQTACMSNLKQVGLGVYGYTTDFKDFYMPRGYEGTGIGYTTKSGNDDNEFMKVAGQLVSSGPTIVSYKNHLALIYPYLQTSKAFVCPAANNLWGWTLVYADNWSPVIRSDGSYYFNANFGGTNTNAKGPFIPRMGQERYNKDKVIYMDGRAGWFGPKGGDPGNNIYTLYGSGTNVGTPHLVNGKGRTDLLFIDGHVESLPNATYSSADVYRTWFRSDLQSTARIN